jgi:hypothetical protein
MSHRVFIVTGCAILGLAAGLPYVLHTSLLPSHMHTVVLPTYIAAARGSCQQADGKDPRDWLLPLQ